MDVRICKTARALKNKKLFQRALKLFEVELFHDRCNRLQRSYMVLLSPWFNHFRYSFRKYFRYHKFSTNRLDSIEMKPNLYAILLLNRPFADIRFWKFKIGCPRWVNSKSDVRFWIFKIGCPILNIQNRMKFKIGHPILNIQNRMKFKIGHNIYTTLKGSIHKTSKSSNFLN